MALDPLEFGTVIAVLLVFFLWGPQKIPELARMIARAKREFDSASREFQKVSTGLQDGTSPLLSTATSIRAAQPTPPPSASPEEKPALPEPSAKTGDQLLIEAARRLGIPTQGKTREQIQQDIVATAQRPSSGPEPSGQPGPASETH